MLACEVHQPTHGLGRKVLSPAIAIRAGLAIAGGVCEDDSRVDAPKVGVAKTQLLHNAGPEVARDDVGVPNEIPNDPLAIGMLEVNAQTELVTIVGCPMAAHAAEPWILPSPDLTCVDALDLDDFGTKVGEDECP